MFSSPKNVNSSSLVNPQKIITFLSIICHILIPHSHCRVPSFNAITTESLPFDPPYQNPINHQQSDPPSQVSSTSPLTPPLTPNSYHNFIHGETPVAQSHLSGPLASQTHIPPASCHPMITRAKNGFFKPKSFPNMLLVCKQTSEPTTVQVALSYPKWKKAMNDEFQALLKNQTWDLVPYHEDMNIVTNKWVFQVKYKVDGSTDRFKAR